MKVEGGSRLVVDRRSVALALILFVPVTTIEPVLVKVPAKLMGLLGDVVVAIVSEPELVTVPPGFGRLAWESLGAQCR